MSKSIIGIFIIFFLSSFTTSEFRSLLRKMTQKYNSDKLFLKLRVTEESQSDTTRTLITIKRNGDAYFITDGVTTSILRDKKYLVINESAKALSYEEVNSQGEGSVVVFQDLGALVDSLGIDSFKISSIDNSTDNYCIWYKNIQYVFAYNKVISTLTSYEVKVYSALRNGKVIERTKIDYLEQRWDVNYDNDDFPIEKYVVKSGNKIKATNVYKDYEIVE